MSKMSELHAKVVSTFTAAELAVLFPNVEFGPVDEFAQYARQEEELAESDAQLQFEQDWGVVD